MTTSTPSAPGLAGPPGEPDSFEARFVAAMRRACTDHGSRAALRRALRRKPEQAVSAHRFLATWTSREDRPLPAYDEAVLYQAASWIAYYDKHTRSGQSLRMGEALGRATRRSTPDGISMSTVENRLIAVTRASNDLLLYTLMPRLLDTTAATRNVPAWDRLIQDLRRWPRSSGRISKQWMGDFYRTVYAPSPTADPAA